MKKIITIILDGFGMREDIYGNAIKNAGMNNFIDLWNNYPHCLLKASGQAVGLPLGQCSNSHIGHQIIGAGRQLEYKIRIANDAFKKNLLRYNDKYISFIKEIKNNSQSNIHIVHLLSDGGVSSHINHLKGFVNELSASKIENNIYLHLIADGRDADKYSVNTYIKEIEGIVHNNIHIASVCGRYYALDDTKDYNRTKMYYELLTKGEGVDSQNLSLVIDKCYGKKLSDEYLPPLKTKDYCDIADNDFLIFLNFSRENQYQLLNSFCNKDFLEFSSYQPNLKVYSLFEIDKNLNSNYFLEESTYKNTLPEYLSKLGMTQAYIYESIKEPSVKYYLNGKRNMKLEGCDLYMLDSPKEDNFDLKPEMNALSIARTAVACMEKDYDFIFLNFANPDEVGHTGNYQATINGLQAIDVCLGKIIEFAEDNFYKIVVIGSHGKADTIISNDNKIVTKNTMSPVPFIIVDKKVKLKNGALPSFAPTLLKYMDIAIPKDMREASILIEKK